MSVPNDYDIIVVTGSDAEIRVDIPWEYTNISELFVWQQDDVSGAVYYFSLGDFTVVENSDQTGKYILVEKIPSAVGAVTINTARETPKTQTYDLVNSQPLDPVALIEALDKAIKLIQETSVEFSPDNQIITSVNPFVIPDKVERAGKILAFDDNGDAIVTTSDEALDDAIKYAEEWAINPEDDPVSTSAGGDGITTFSSLHWSAKSSGHADDSEGFATDSSNSATDSANSATESANSATDSSNSATASETSAQESADSAQEAIDAKPKYALIEDQKPSGTNGGTFTAGAWRTRDLNTITSDDDSIVSINANQFTLQAGTYVIEASAPAYRAGGHVLRLYNVNDAISESVGQVSYDSGTAQGESFSTLRTTATLIAPKTFEIQHRGDRSISINGFGVACSFDTSVFTQVKITKIG